jgi:putative DNA primase/helicase
MIEEHLEGVDLLILDNLSALCRHGKENEGEGWLPVQEWALSLRRRGTSVVFVHHAGKGGTQRGTSRREDLLDTVLAMRRPADYSPEQGLRAEVHVEKGRSLFGDAAKPFEMKLETGAGGAAVWTMRDLEGAQARQVADMSASGMSIREIADEMRISKSKVARLRDSMRDTRPSVPLSHCPAPGQRDSNANGGSHVGRG